MTLKDELEKTYRKDYNNAHPWLKTYRNIMKRCNNPKHKGYKYYGGKGIKCLLTPSQLHFLWKRDRADKLKSPSIDRRDSSKDYTHQNCRFIEWSQDAVDAAFSVRNQIMEAILQLSPKVNP